MPHATVHTHHHQHHHHGGKQHHHHRKHHHQGRTRHHVSHNPVGLSFLVEAEDHKDNKRYHFPYGPQATTIDNIANVYQSVDRPGRVPLYLMSGKGLATCAFTITIAHRDNQVSIDPWLKDLYALAHTPRHVIVYFGNVRGHWHLSGCTLNTTMYNADNDPSQATADLTFTRVSDPQKSQGPVSGGHHKKGGKKASTGHKSNRNQQVRVYHVQHGDSLHSISRHFYGEADKWKKIAQYNHIVHPHKQLRVGKLLKIPPE